MQITNRRPRVSNVTELIVAARAENPSITASELAEKVGLTRQRVSQLIKDMKLPPRLSRSKSIGKMGLVNTQSKNLVAELAVLQDLIERGYSVYRPITMGNDEIDIIAGRSNGSLITIDVKPDRIPGKSRIDEDTECDCVASVSSIARVGEPISYKVSYKPDIETMIKMTIRTPA